MYSTGTQAGVEHSSELYPAGGCQDRLHRWKRVDEHPAYTGYEGIFQTVDKFFDDPQTPEKWNTPESIAEGIYETVISGGEILRRVPLGPDAWGIPMADHERTGRELESGKELAMKLGNAEDASNLSSLFM